MKKVAAITTSLAIIAIGMAAQPASGNIGLTRKEAKQDAEQVVHSLWPGAWKKNEHNLHCIQRKPHKFIPCPPVNIYKRLGRTEIQTLFSLVLNEHPYREIRGSVYIHSDPSSIRGFYFRVERCNTKLPYNCWEVN